MQIVIEILGWMGAVLYLIAYALVSMKKVEADSIPFQGMNIFAGLLLIINTLYWKSYPSLGLNIAWVGIGLVALAKKRAR